MDRPASFAALRKAICSGTEPPPARFIASRASYRWLVVGTVCVGAFMGQVDSSITQLLLPLLEAQFDASLSTVSWVAVAYLLTMAAFLPIFGRLADMMGRKLLYTGGFLLFVLGSGLCGLAPSLPVLIGFRVLQAIGAALLSSNSVAIVVAAAGDELRGRALGIQAAAQAVGLSAGPAIGGMVLDWLDWRWVFWINVPVGLAGTVLGWFVLAPTSGLPDKASFDWKGAMLIAPALTAAVAVLNEGYAWGAASPLLLGLAALAVILLTLFVRAERRAQDPLIDLKLFGRRAFSAGSVAGLLAYAALFGLFFLMPFVFMRAYRDSALAAGLRLCIVPVMIGVVAPMAGALYDSIGARWPTVLGMLVCIGACVMLGITLDGARDGLPLVMLGLAVFGAGQGLFISPNNSAIVAAAPARLTGEAGGLVNVMRSCGVSIGVAAASSLLAWRLAALTGSGLSTLHADAAQLLCASRDVIAVLGGLAAIAGAVSLAQTQPACSRRRGGKIREPSSRSGP